MSTVIQLLQKKSVHLFSYKGYQELSSMVCIEKKKPIK
uniref:Uncharacterized protein n=2 Tax=Enterococcus TaxID=1350 RepID=D2JET6_ENTFC|nr:hypothetical protein SAP083B_036 [Enterococcus faecium]AEF32549.1 hypothetical protein pLG2-0054 [Enterococcus faecalis]